MAAGPKQWVDDARRGVRCALQQWNPADLKGIEQCRKLLEQSANALRVAIDLLRNGDSTMATGLQPLISGLRRDISTMIRLVDACSAFRRGMALRHGVALSAYDASGKAVGEPVGLSAHGVVG